MITSKTALAAAAFGFVAATTQANAEETRYNFSSEIQNREIAADSRQGGERSGTDPSAHPRGGPEVGELSLEEFVNWWRTDFVNFFHGRTGETKRSDDIRAVDRPGRSNPTANDRWRRSSGSDG